MVAINNYSVSLSLDAGNYIKNSSLSRSETNRLRRAIGQARSPMERYQLEVDRLGKAFKSGAIDQRVYNRLLSEQKQRLKQATNANRSMTATITRMGAAYLSVASAVRIVTDGIKVLAEREQQQISLKVMLGSAEEARNLSKSMREFAASTPFAEQAIMRATKGLVAFKFSAAETQEAIRVLGNISAGSGAPINELAEIIGKIRVQNRVFMEDINQLSGRGINVLDGLALKFGDVRKAVADGKVEFQDLYQVIKDLSASDFGGLTEELGQSLEGRWSTFNDQLNESKSLIGQIALGVDELFGAFSKSGSGVSNFNKNMNWLLGNTGREQRQALADAELARATNAYELAKRRHGVAGVSSAEVSAMAKNIARKQNAQFWNNAGSYFAPKAAKSAGSMARSAGMAGQGLMAGFQKLGMTIADSFKFNTEKQIQVQRTIFAPVFESAAEAQQAILRSQQQAAKDVASQEREKEQVSLLQSLGLENEKHTSYLEEMLSIWRDGPIKRIR